MNAGLPATSSAVPVAISARAEDVAEILARSRAGCLAPVGAVVIIAAGFMGAVRAGAALSSSAAQVYIGAVVAAAFAWALTPTLVQRRRATLALRAWGLSAAQIRDIRAVALPIVRARGGLDGERTRTAILEALRELPLFAPHVEESSADSSTSRDF